MPLSTDLVARAPAFLRTWSAAGVQVLTAVVYASAVWAERPWLGFTREWLAMMMQIEFLVIHSFAFIMLIALIKPKTVFQRIFRWTGFSAFLALYVYGAWQMGGWLAIVTFAGLTMVTYLGAMLHKLSIGELILTGARWLFNMLAFQIISTSTGTPEIVNEWVGQPSVLRFGLWYFLALAVFESCITAGRALLMKAQQSNGEY